MHTSRNRLPFILLLSSSIVIFAAFFLFGELRLQLRDDSLEYILIAKNFSSQSIFSGNRTLGYPLLLKCTQLFSSDLTLLPVVQFMLHVGAVYLFYLGLRVFGFNSWIAFLAALPLLTLTLFKTHVGQVMADLPATSLSIATIGILFIVMKKPRNRLVWMLLMFSMTFAYQIRPTMLYLIGFIPFFGSFLLFKIHGKSFKKNLRPIIYLLLISLLPFLLFNVLRYRYVKETGLSSFDGYSLAGIALHMLDENEIKRMPAPLSGIAKKMLERKEKMKRARYNSDYEQMQEEYNLNIWLVAIPVLAEEFGNYNFVEYNAVLREMSYTILWDNKCRYLKYVALSFKEGVLKSLGLREKYFWGMFCIVSYACYVLTSLLKKDNVAENPAPSSSGPIYLLAVLAIVNYCFGILPFLVYHPPMLRYIASIDMYFVSLLGASSIYFLLKSRQILFFKSQT